MRPLRQITPALAGALLAIPAALAAQSNPIELGADAGLTVQLGDPTITSIGLPLQQVRGNFFIGNTWSIEARLGYTRTSVEDGPSTSNLGVEVGPMINFGSPTRYGNGRPVGDWYVRPSLLISNRSFDPDRGDGDSDSDIGFAGAVGTRLPLLSNRAALRFEGQIGKFSEVDDPFLQFSVGLSFFVR